MSKFVQNVISQRFLEVLDELLDKRIIDSVATFCAKADYAPQSMSQIRNGKRDVTLELVSKLFTEFGGSPLYIFSGKGEKVLSPELVLTAQEPPLEYGKSDKALIETLERLVKAKEDNVSDLRNVVQRLEKYISFLEQKVKQ